MVENNLSPKDTKSEEHDDAMIDLTKDRIQQELSNISSDELKSSFLVGISATLLGILFAIGPFNDLIKTNNLAWIPIILLVLNCLIQIGILFPRSRMKLMLPRQTNDDFGNKDLPELKKAIKDRLIENYEYIAKERKYDGNIIRIGFILLMASVVIFIAFVTQVKPNV